MKKLKIFIFTIFTVLTLTSRSKPVNSQQTELKASTNISTHQKNLQETFDDMIICLGA